MPPQTQPDQAYPERAHRDDARFGELQLDALPSRSPTGTSPLHDYVGLRYADGRMRWLSLSIGNSPDLIVSDGQHSKLLKENVAPWQLLYPSTSWPEEAPW